MESPGFTVHTVMLNLSVHRLAREFCLEHEAATHGGKVVGMLQEVGYSSRCWSKSTLPLNLDPV